METRPRIGLQDVHHGQLPRRSPLFAPVRYLWIKAATKARYDVVLPAVLGVSLWCVYNAAGSTLTVFGASGVLADLQGLLQMAVPFLIGALATVAMSSPSEALDRRLVGSPVTLDGVSLTTRQFVCYLLGYLSFLGFTIFLAILLVKNLNPLFALVLSEAFWVREITAQMFAAGFCLLLAAFCVTTFWALFFLTDVVNRRP